MPLSFLRSNPQFLSSYALKLRRGTVVSFGIGGQIVLSFPPSLYGATGYFAQGAGPVEIVPLSAAIKGTQYESSLSTFPCCSKLWCEYSLSHFIASYPGPLTSAKTPDVVQFLNKKLDSATVLSEVERLLLRVLSVYASKQGVLDAESFSQLNQFVSQDVHSNGGSCIDSPLFSFDA